MGTFLVTPDVPYDTGFADTENLAGARVIRMISLSKGGTPPDVNTVYNDARGNNDVSDTWPGWWIDPQGMIHGVYDYDPRPPRVFSGHWVPYLNTVQSTADTQIQSTLKNYNTAAAVLIYGGKHWVCVIGYTFNDANQLTGFVINDPSYDAGGASMPVTLAMWDSVFTPVSGGTRWLGKYVEIGDPQPVKDVLEYAPRPVAFPGDQLIDAQTAVKIALEGAMEQFGELKNIRAAIERGHPGDPRLVARLDHEGSYYYLVPLETEGGRNAMAIGAIVVDARFGDVLSASGTEGDAFPLWPIGPREVEDIITRAPIPIYRRLDDAADHLMEELVLDRSRRARAWAARERPSADRDEWESQTRPSLRQSLVSTLATVATPHEFIQLTPREFVIDPILAWAPCRSVSMYHPYYVVHTAARNLYVSAKFGTVISDADFCYRNRLGA